MQVGRSLRYVLKDYRIGLFKGGVHDVWFLICQIWGSQGKQDMFYNMSLRDARCARNNVEL